MDNLARFRRGDEVLFRDLVEEHSPRLLGIARPFAEDLDEAHDLVQETWVRAYAKRELYEGRGPLLGWLCAICRNICVSASRRGAAGRHSSLDRDGRDEPIVELAGSSKGEPDTASERAALRRAVGLALMELSGRQRDVVIYRMLEGRSTRETAKALDVAEGTVKATLHHALARLAPHLEDWAPGTRERETERR